MEKRDNIDAEFDKFLLEIDKINMILNGSKKEEEPTEVKIKMNKTLINNRDFITDCMDDRHGETKESFMERMETDIEQRHQDRLKRDKNCDLFRNQAKTAFKNNEYENALVLYHKAIGEIKDCPNLYVNRALTKIRLGLFKQSLLDLNLALELKRPFLKALLLKAKAYYFLNDHQKSELCIQEATETCYQQFDFIKENSPYRFMEILSKCVNMIT